MPKSMWVCVCVCECACVFEEWAKGHLYTELHQEAPAQGPPQPGEPRTALPHATVLRCGGQQWRSWTSEWTGDLHDLVTQEPLLGAMALGLRAPRPAQRTNQCPQNNWRQGSKYSGGFGALQFMAPSLTSLTSSSHTQIQKVCCLSLNSLVDTYFIPDENHFLP